MPDEFRTKSQCQWDEKENLKGWFSARHILAFMGLLGFANAYAMRVNLAVAIVAMVNSSALNSSSTTSSDICAESQDSHHLEGEFDWNEYKQGIILGSFSCGYVVTQIPGGLLAERFGGKLTFGLGNFVCAILTLLTPLAARTGSALLIILRVLEGLAQGFLYPSMHVLLAKWVPPQERSKLSAITYSGSEVGTVTAIFMSGVLAESGFVGGWPLIFYAFGSLAVLWFVFWCILIFDSPDDHPRISVKERQYIKRNIIQYEMKVPPVPWLSVASSLPVWSTLVAHVGQNWGFYTLLNELPTYMKNVLHFDMKQNSTLSALPFLLMWIFTILVSFLAHWVQKRQCFSTTVIRKLGNTIATCGPALALVGASYTGCDYKMTVALLTVAVILNAPQYISVLINHLDLSPNYAGVLMGITNCAANIPGFFAPYVTGMLISGQQTLGQWQIVFFISAAVYITCDLFYVLFGSGNEQSWNRYWEKPAALLSNGEPNAEERSLIKLKDTLLKQEVQTVVKAGGDTLLGSEGDTFL